MAPLPNNRDVGVEGPQGARPLRLGAISARRMTIIASLFIIAIHLYAAGRGGLLEPLETATAQTALNVMTGEASSLTPHELTGETALVPPLTTWLGSLGLRLVGASTMGARFLPALAAALLLILSFIVLQRRLGGRLAAILCFGAIANPMYLLHCGHLGPAGISTAAIILTLSCLVALTGQDHTRAPRWIAALLGAAAGISALAGGPAAMAVPALAVLGALVIVPSEQNVQPRTWRLTLAGGLAVIGAVLLWAGLSDGRAGWPGSASLALLQCGATEAPSALLTWSGTGLIIASVISLASARALRLGLHIATPVALLLSLPWYLLVSTSPNAPELCTALAQALDEWPSNQEIAAIVRNIGYGLYPWMALLPLSVYRATMTKDGTLRAVASVLIIFVSASLVPAFLGATPYSVSWTATTTALAILSVIGLAIDIEEERDVLGERVACVVGVMLLYIVLRDIRHDPSIVAALALPPSVEIHLLASSLPFIVGAVTCVGLLLTVLGGFETTSRWGCWLAHRAGFFAIPVTVAALGASAFLVVHIGMTNVSDSTSWSHVFETYTEHRQGEDGFYGWREIGESGRFYAGTVPSSLDRARDVRRVLSRHESKTFFATKTLYYRELSGLIHRITGARLQPLNSDRRHQVLAVYEGPGLADVDRPAKIVREVPEAEQREPERLSGGAVELVGADVSANRAHPGDTLSIRLYLKCVRTPARDVRARFRLRPRRRDNRWRFSVEHDTSDGGLPAKQWRPNQIILDESELVIPNDAALDRYGLEIELIGSGGGRAEIGTLRIE